MFIKCVTDQINGKLVVSLLINLIVVEHDLKLKSISVMLQQEF